mgnify:CR=1 FL=1
MLPLSGWIMPLISFNIVVLPVPLFVVARAVVVVECMTALVLADALLVGMSAKLDNVKKVWALDEK